MNPLIQSALTRAARTFLQVFLAVYLTGLASVPADDRSLHTILNLPLIEKALVAAVAAILAFIHRAVLDPAPVPSLQDPAPGPVPERP